MKPIAVNKDNFQNQVLESPVPVLVDFWASWCGPCRMVGPILDEIAEENEHIRVVKINVDENPELAARFQIVSIPTLMVVENGKILSRSSGAKPKAQILAMLP
ncbi:MAG: thioredoxin [Oscillospiraceae bacterium]|nr:thioredoxin [Oscillospiraceae bacterium]